MSNEWNLLETNYSVVKDISYEVAVLPVGAIEPHGLHLPYGCDTLHSRIIAKRVCGRAWDRGAKVVMLPGLPYGVDTNQMEFPLAMNVHQSTLNTIVGDLIDSLEKHRIPKLVILNGHGGNEFKSFLREIYGETEVFVSLVNWWQMALDHRKSIFVAKGDHADELETSVALALFGELVEMKNASDGTIHQTNIEAINEGWAQITRPWHLATNDSTMGDPRAATAEKGEAYLKIIEERLTDYLVQLAAEPMSEHFPYP